MVVGADVGDPPDAGADEVDGAEDVDGEGIKTVGVAAALDGAALGEPLVPGADDGHGFVDGEDGDWLGEVGDWDGVVPVVPGVWLPSC